MKRNDWLLVSGLVVISLGLWFALGFGGRPAHVADISLSGRPIGQILLGQNGTYEMQGALGSFEVAVKDGSVCMASSACPDQLCVKQGAIRQGGQSIICLPNQVAVTLSGSDDLDAVTH